MLTLLWSRIYWSWMKCVQFYLFSLFVWLAIFVYVCLIIKIIKAPTEVAIRRKIALESTLLVWCSTHLSLTTSLTCLWVTISLFCEVLLLCCLLTDWAHYLVVQCTVQLYSVMHVHFTVCLFDNMYCQSLS